MKADYEITSFEIGGLIITEPMTALTDVLLAITCFIAFFRLLKLNK